MKTIKAIETHYDGYRFRSRLEARWAVFFKVLNIPYEYEKEGYELSDGQRYLPDFWLPTFDMFFEIKPRNGHNEGFSDFTKFTQEVNKPIILCQGSSDDYTLTKYSDTYIEENISIQKCKQCQLIYLGSLCPNSCIISEPTHNEWGIVAAELTDTRHADVLKAISTAKMAQFENRSNSKKQYYKRKKK